jgi:hypothetical protein
MPYRALALRTAGRCLPADGSIAIRGGNLVRLRWSISVAETLACKICGPPSPEAFRIPKSKKTGHPIPDLPDDCPYYECSNCGFCFSTLLDDADHTEIYDEAYWVGQDPDWYGRVSETLRLALLANQLAQRPDRLEILDFGCGMGTFVETCRRNLQLDAWGTDIIKPKFGADYFLPKVDRKFDIVVACGVMGRSKPFGLSAAC